MLEHTQEPLNVLRGPAPYTEPDTLMRITVSNITRAPSSIFWKDFPFNGSQMHILSLYEHLQCFNPESLKLLLHRAGLVPERTFASLWTHPLHQTRLILSPLMPSIATTLVLVRPMPHF